MYPAEIEPLFPNNPNVGDIFTSPDGSRTWEWNGSRWVLISSGAAPSAVQTPWLSDIDADEFRLGAVGQIIVGNIGSTPFSPAYPSVIIDSHGVTWYDVASISERGADGLRVSVNSTNAFSNVTVNANIVRTHHIHTGIPYVGVYSSVEMNAGLVGGLLSTLGSEILWRGERFGVAGDFGPGLKRFALRKTVSQNLDLIRYDDDEAPRNMMTFYRTENTIGGILCQVDINCYNQTYIATSPNLDGFRLQEYYGFNWFALNNENSNLNFDGNYLPANTRFRIMEMDFRNRLITSHAPMTINGDVNVNGRLFINGVEVYP